MDNEIYFDKTELKKRKDVLVDVYKGIKFSIKSLGSHPCAYIHLPKGHFLYGVYYDEIDLNVHGGLTYSSEVDNEYLIGWDYAHHGDLYYYPQLNDIKGKSYTVKEIVGHIKKAIDQLQKLKKFQVKKYYFAVNERDW